ncbi:NAD kinase [Candidatus Symbiothrix dinenymphae]|nr:NAD kinase [Candidatus Symbiothrix dinenymphae]
MKIGVFGSNYQADKQQFITKLLDDLKQRGAVLWIEQPFYDYLTKTMAYKPEIQGIITAENCPLDMIIGLGGDGTFLRAAHWVGRQNIPILGINTGHLGFLAQVGMSEIDTMLPAIVGKHYQVEERSLLQISAPYPTPCNYALNEIAFLKRDTASMVDIQAYINDDYLTEYLADGLIVATPTGSTAYNLSVNGPILIPQTNNFVLSAVAPHSLNMRSLVMPDSSKLRVRIEARTPDFLVSLDGRSLDFPSGTEFVVQKADFTVKMVKHSSQNFYHTLRKKLLWGTDVRQ